MDLIFDRNTGITSLPFADVIGIYHFLDQLTVSDNYQWSTRAISNFTSALCSAR
jgi:hypothetical protein